MKFFWIMVMFLCGGLLPFQAGLNAKLGKHLSSSLQASMICFVVGALIAASLVAFQRNPFSIVGIKSAGVVALLGGGIIGVFFITLTMLALPRLGMALTFGLIVAGQVMIAMLLDHFQIFVPQHSINIWRILGMALIIIGVIVVQKF